ncbi:hypothetical protein C456_11089 [Haloferax volcanii DSM 14919]|uniref:DUF2797 domain-containing protein n=1 Tax=Haloferax lucentense (strain DSM 14919 / JCM 9276 / NCIMB 13854 / Aa 2.2) TaxID=1230452 RepID=M0GQ30_HALL2|nr:DUF2797 domain-containing protein [Haloferax lucentense]ELZ73602.1 hypothetical protein C456_11089 [Haloferax lucentense DSM 14919]
MQVVGYDTGTPALLVSASDGIDSVALAPGTELDYRLGDRHCAGTIHDDRHVACDNTRAPYCSDHRHTWVCAKCTGTCLKDEMDCYEDHAVYLAAFAPDTFKVGVTREWRLDTRLREQGADRAAHVRTFSDGRVAREYEAELATEIPDRIRVPTKIEGFGRSVDAAAWDDLLAQFDLIETFAFDYGLDLDDSPVAETVATGTVRGVKGRVLVLDHRGTTYAVDLRDLVGHELDDGGTDRDLQSSLGAFG